MTFNTAKDKIYTTMNLSNENSLLLLLTVCAKLSVIAESQLSIFLIGEQSLGKSFIYENLDSIASIYPDTITSALLRGNATKNNQQTLSTDSCFDNNESTPIFSKNLAVIEEFSTLSPEVLSELKNFLTSHTYNYQKRERTLSTLSLVCTGNSYAPIFSRNDLRSEHILENFHSNFKDKALLSRILFIPHFNSILGTVKYSGEIDKNKVTQLGEELFKLRDYEPNFNIKINKNFFDSRGEKIIKKLIHGIIKVLYGKNHCPEYVVDGITEFASFFYSIGINKPYNPINKLSCIFLLEALHGNTDDVDFVILEENRILVKLLNQPYCLKYAINGFGASDNLAEYTFYNNFPSDYIAKIMSLENNNLILRQEFNYLPVTSDIIKFNSSIDEKFFIEDEGYNFLLIEMAKSPVQKDLTIYEFRGLPEFLLNSFKNKVASNTSLKIKNLNKSSISLSKSKDKFEIISFVGYIPKD